MSNAIMKSLIRPVVALLLFAGFFLGFYLMVPYVLYFYEQHYLFVFTGDYFSHSVHFKGLLHTLTVFFIQFNAVPALGAAVWALILTAIYLMLQSVVYRLTGLHDRLQLTTLPSIYLFSQMTDMEYFPQPVVTTLLALLPVWLLAMGVSRLLPWRRRINLPDLTPRRAIGSMLLAPAFMAVGYLALCHPTVTSKEAKAERVMLQTQRLVQEQRWDDVLRVCNEWSATGRKNHLMSYFRSLALAHTGRLNDHLFDVAQPQGLKALFFPWLGNKSHAEYGHMVFEHMGAINSAHRWAFERMVGNGETPEAVRNLARYNIVMNRPVVAARYINLLDHTLFYRDEARRLRAQLAEGRVEGLRDALAGVPSTPARWDNVLNIAADARYILNYDPDNTVARDYLLNAMLLVGNVDAFVRNLAELMPASEHPVLPAGFQQALLIYRMTAGTTAMESLGYTISPEVEKAFSQFMATDAKGKAAIFTPAMRQTYWYYLRKTLPKVNHDFSRDKKPQVQS